MEAEAIVIRCEETVRRVLNSYLDCHVRRFEPSVVSGRRYIGLVNTKTDEQFLITIEVEKAEPKKTPTG